MLTFGSTPGDQRGTPSDAMAVSDCRFAPVVAHAVVTRVPGRPEQSGGLGDAQPIFPR